MSPLLFILGIWAICSAINGQGSPREPYRESPRDLRRRLAAIASADAQPPAGETREARWARVDASNQAALLARKSRRQGERK